MMVRGTIACLVAAVVLSACSQAPAVSSLPTLRPLQPASGLPASAAPLATVAPTIAPTATPTLAPTLAPTPVPTSVPTAAPTAPPTASPTRAPTRVPTRAPTIAPSASADTVPFPNDAESQLISHVLPALQATCERTERIYTSEVDSITCGDDILVDYTMFASLDDVKAAYEDDVAGSETKPVANGTCAKGNLETDYSIGDTPAGRLQCREHTSSSGLHYHVVEWTNESLLTIGYISNRVKTWEEIIAFWKDDAGPFL